MMKAERKYRFIFVKYGTVKPPNSIPKDQIWLDVGNSLEIGCIDHHQTQCDKADEQEAKNGSNEKPEIYYSTFSALMGNLNLLNNLKTAVADPDRVITVYLHEDPDMDAVASFFLVKTILEEGDITTEEVTWQKFKEYVDDIDRGRKKNVESPTLYALFCALGAEYQDEDKKLKRTNDEVVDLGVELLSLVRHKLDKDPNFNLYKANLKEEITLPESVQYAVSMCEQNIESYKMDNTGEDKNIWIWGKDNKKYEVEATFWKEPHKDERYVYARNRGKVVTVVSRSARGVNGAETTQVVISVNPDVEEADKYSLLPFAEIIEQMEQLEEQRLFEQTGVYRRGRDRARESDGRFARMPFAATSDPWYISEVFDIIDSPRIGSVLDHEDIRAIIEHNGCEVKKYLSIELGGKTDKQESVSISKWQKDVMGFMESSEHHVITWAELDSSLIRKNNRMLEAFCMKMTGQSLSERNEGDFIFPDYRTCIYTDLNITIILSATYEGCELILKDLLNTDDVEKYKASKLVQTITKIIKQRETLLDLKSQTGTSGPDDRKSIEELNRRLRAFSTEVHKDDAEMYKDGILEQISKFLKERFEIETLKESIGEDLGILLNESRESLVGKFNRLSSIAVPFVIIATVFQMGLLKFDELINISMTPYKWIAWGATALVTAAWIVYLLKGAIRRGKHDRKTEK